LQLLAVVSLGLSLESANTDVSLDHRKDKWHVVVVVVLVVVDRGRAIILCRLIPFEEEAVKDLVDFRTTSNTIMIRMMMIVVVVCFFRKILMLWQ
jgi:hypothetical protein